MIGVYLTQFLSWTSRLGGLSVFMSGKVERGASSTGVTPLVSHTLHVEDTDNVRLIQLETEGRCVLCLPGYVWVLRQNTQHV